MKTFLICKFENGTFQYEPPMFGEQKSLEVGDFRTDPDRQPTQAEKIQIEKAIKTVKAIQALFKGDIWLNSDIINLTCDFTAKPAKATLGFKNENGFPLYKRPNHLCSARAGYITAILDCFATQHQKNNDSPLFRDDPELRVTDLDVLNTALERAMKQKGVSIEEGRGR